MRLSPKKRYLLKYFPIFAKVSQRTPELKLVPLWNLSSVDLMIFLQFTPIFYKEHVYVFGTVSSFNHQSLLVNFLFPSKVIAINLSKVEEVVYAFVCIFSIILWKCKNPLIMSFAENKTEYFLIKTAALDMKLEKRPIL